LAVPSGPVINETAKLFESRLRLARLGRRSQVTRAQPILHPSDSKIKEIAHAIGERPQQMAAIVLAGAVAYRQSPVSALPEIDYPTIQVLTFYPGASPGVMASSVTSPLERQFGQVPGLKQMTSNSSFGSSIITLQFVLTLNIDVAEQEVQASINAASSYLPADLPNPPIYSKTNPADAPILTLALTSTELPTGPRLRIGGYPAYSA